MVSGHPLTASTADRPSGWVLWTTDTDVAPKSLSKNKMPCTRENHRLLLWGFSSCISFLTMVRNRWLQIMCKKPQGNRQLQKNHNYWTDEKQHQSQGYWKGKRLRKCLSFWQQFLDRTIYYIHSFLISMKEIMGIALLHLRAWIKVLTCSAVKYKVKQCLTSLTWSWDWNK